jgi:hypothetical protein
MANPTPGRPAGPARDLRPTYRTAASRWVSSIATDAESSLKQLACPGAARVEDVGMALVGLTDRTSQPVSRLRRRDEVDVIWHQAAERSITLPSLAFSHGLCPQQHLGTSAFGPTTLKAWCASDTL